MKVSVIIPVYNVEPYVEECLRSVLGQSMKELEIICIHDAGQDDSWEVVKSVTAGDDRVRLYENERNIGLAATRNRGLGLAHGKYVYFLDSDDMIRPDALEILYKRAESEQLEVQVFGASFVYETKELEEKFRSNPAGFKKKYPEVMNGRELFIAWMDVWDWLSSQPRYFYSRDFLTFHNIRYIEGMLHEDETFAFDVLMHAQRIRVSDDAFFIRRFRSDSIMTGNPTMRNVDGCVKILEHVTSLQNIYNDDAAWNRAVKYYVYKIFCDVCRKYEAVSDSEKTGDERPLIYHLIEAFALWRET